MPPAALPSPAVLGACLVKLLPLETSLSYVFVGCFCLNKRYVQVVQHKWVHM